jgi:hypothetical protein
VTATTTLPHTPYFLITMLPATSYGLTTRAEESPKRVNFSCSFARLTGHAYEQLTIYFTKTRSICNVASAAWHLVQPPDRDARRVWAR